jgi:hypothetical protein
MPLGFEALNGIPTLQVRAVCNLYSITTNQEAIIRLFRVINRYVGNLPPMPGVFGQVSEAIGTANGHPCERLSALTFALTAH